MTVAGAIQELRTAPWPLLLEVLDLRAYARDKRAWDGAENPHMMTMTPGLQRVRSVLDAIRAQRLKEQGER
jgi:hypothetical protein